MNYNYRTGANRVDFVKVLLVGLGLLIGMSVGFWVAVRTIPLPSQNTIYEGGYNDHSR